MNPSFKKFFIHILILSSWCIFVNNTVSWAGWLSESTTSGQDYSDVHVARIIDSDSFILESREKIRLIGLKAPEVPKNIHIAEQLKEEGTRRENLSTAPVIIPNKEIDPKVDLSTRSYRFIKEMLEGKNVRLEFDTQSKDDDFFTLAYAYLEDGTFVNAEILRQGYASLKILPPNTKYADQLREAYREAREEKKGLHSE